MNEITNLLAWQGIALLHYNFIRTSSSTCDSSVVCGPGPVTHVEMQISALTTE